MAMPTSIARGTSKSMAMATRSSAVTGMPALPIIRAISLAL